MTDGGGNSDCQGARHQFELSGASLRFMRNLAMYMPRPVYNHQFKLAVPGNQTSSSNTENIHTAATILIQAQRGLILLCGHAAKSTPNRIFSPRFIGIAGVVAIFKSLIAFDDSYNQPCSYAQVKQTKSEKRFFLRRRHIKDKYAYK